MYDSNVIFRFFQIAKSRCEECNKPLKWEDRGSMWNVIQAENNIESTGSLRIICHAHELKKCKCLKSAVSSDKRNWRIEISNRTKLDEFIIKKLEFNN